MEDLIQQAEEIEALSSIYGSDWKCDDEASRSYRIEINEYNHNVQLYFKLPEDYPSKSPPQFEFSAPNLSRYQKQDIALALDDVYLDNLEQPILYQWIEKVREKLFSFSNQTIQESVENKPVQELKLVNFEDNNDILNVKHGELIQDRKSTFQGHVAEVHSKAEVQKFLDYLKQNRKIAQATHNILAYRIKDDKTGTILQDCDDDGETHAGKRVLHLLNILDIYNVAVVVTRWYGGIHLGPDRFRHINNAARQILEMTGYIKSKK